MSIYNLFFFSYSQITFPWYTKCKHPNICEVTLVRKRVPLEKKTTKNGKLNGTPIVYTDEIIENYADELLDWVQDEKNYILLGFCNERMIIADNLAIWADCNPKFARSLKIAKQTIAQRREDMANKDQLNYGVYQRYQGMYDPNLHKFERAEKAYEAELKRQIISNSGGNISLNITDYGK